MDGPQFEPELHKKFTEQVYKEVKEVLEKAIDNLNPRGACARQLAPGATSVPSAGRQIGLKFLCFPKRAQLSALNT